MDEKLKRRLLAMQKNEITEYAVYSKLAAAAGDPQNRAVLQQIAADEKRHAEFWKTHTGVEVKPGRFTVWKFVFITRVLGLTFGIKLMERGESAAQEIYDEISRDIPAARDILKEEEAHEDRLTSMIDEERLKYVGSMVLGLNDALVELTGALAGFTLALQQARLVAVTGLITGIAAALSMAASEYLSTGTEVRAGRHERTPIKAAVYTGIAYIITVFFLIFPFLLFGSPFHALAFTLANAVVVILLFTFYISVAQGESFWKRFLEMAALSFGVAIVSFGIGYLARFALPD